ncbi:hypothetical protein SAMN05216598_3577 [Pseudomonas asplenii]|uniref:Uncharacterized protein n=1 Tax=Pseudomonas asplenii TaxID=53407 RepID=A0A1H1WT56_9PSED|nr:hypothetical protein SAMN05216598_3577 [Pseudomonas asplenii]
MERFIFSSHGQLMLALRVSHTSAYTCEYKEFHNG